jgi:hypothetical protein
MQGAVHELAAGGLQQPGGERFVQRLISQTDSDVIDIY